MIKIFSQQHYFLKPLDKTNRNDVLNLFKQYTPGTRKERRLKREVKK